MASRFRPTNLVDEYKADRVPVFLDRSDLAYLSRHCCCGENADDATRERCARIRFRCMAAAHKLDAPAAEVRPDAPCDFVAYISLVPTDQGGDHSGIASGYRPQMFIDGDDCDVKIWLDESQLNPGDSSLVYGQFFRPDVNVHKLTVGKAVLLREGSRTIGFGTVLWRRTSEPADGPERPVTGVSDTG